MGKARPEKERTYHGAILAMVLLCLALIVNEIYGEHGYLALRHQEKEYSTLRQEVRKLQEENQQLEKYIEALKSDPKTIERIAREQMHMAGPKELIYTLPEKDKAPKTQDPVAAENAKLQP
jgi:cell division protein FtsB